MQADRISHVIPETTPCANIKSRKDPKKRCTNAVTHGEFCGIHYKHPRPWCPGSPASIGLRVRHRRRGAKPLVFGVEEAIALRKIKAWWRLKYGLAMRRIHGPAHWARSLCTNDSDFFSTDPVTDISGCTFYSYKDIDNHVYGFDIRSVHTLLYRARLSSDPALNPFTRSPFPPFVKGQVQK